MGGYGEALRGYKVYAGGGRPKGADMAPRTIEQIMAEQKRLRQTRGLASREVFKQARAMSFGDSRSPEVEALLRPLTERLNKVGTK